MIVSSYIIIMKKALLISIMITYSAWIINAQITFQKTISFGWDAGGHAINIDGGYIIAGSSPVFLIKTDLNGNMLWHKSFYNTGEDEWSCSSVVQANDGGYILAGSTNIYGGGISDAFVIKTDDSGNLIWSKTYGGNNDDYSSDLQKTNDGCYVMIGSTSSFGAGLVDVFLLKIDPNGFLLWGKTYGGINNESANSVQQTKDCGYIIAGWTESPEPGIDNAYMIKTDSSGNFQWSRSFGKAVNASANSIQQTKDGGYIIAVNGVDINMIKIDTSGSILWSRTYGGYLAEHVSSVRETTDGGYVIVGATNSFGSGWNDFDVYLIKTKADGIMDWSRLYGDELLDAGNSVWPTSDGGYILAGSARSFSNIFNKSECYLIKTDSSGYTGCYMSTPATSVDTVSFVSDDPTTITTAHDFFSATYVLEAGTSGTMRNLCSTVDLQEVVNKNSFSIFPNPSSTSVTVSVPLITPLKNATMSVFNVNGQQVLSRLITEETTAICINELPRGMYFVQITSDKTTMTSKFIKQ